MCAKNCPRFNEPLYFHVESDQKSDIHFLYNISEYICETEIETFLSAEWRIKRRNISRRYSRERYCHGTCEIIVREIKQNCVYKFHITPNDIRLRSLLSYRKELVNFFLFFLTLRTWNPDERKFFSRLNIRIK